MQIPPNILKVCILIIILISGFFVLQFFMLIHPFKIKTKVTPESLNLKYENVSFKTDDNILLKGWFIPSGSSNATIIICHGYPADKNNLLMTSEFILSHYNIFLFDFRYFGESDGWYTTGGYKEQKDIEAAVKYLRSRKDAGKIGALGFSLGASTILMSHPKEIEAIIADSPYANMELLLEQVYWIFPSFTKKPFIWMTRALGKLIMGVDIKDISPVDEMKKIKAPVLLIHGSKDRQIPAMHSRYIYDSSNKSNTDLWIIEGARHGWNYALNPDEYKDRVIEFFDKHLKE